MSETQLTGRQIQMVVLVIVIFMGGMLAYVFTILPTNNDPVGSRRVVIVSAMIGALAAAWLAKLIVNALQDRKRGIARGPAKVSGWFNIIFGAAVATGGIICSALTFWSAVAGGEAIWTLYWGMIAWGIVQMLFGLIKLRRHSSNASNR